MDIDQQYLFKFIHQDYYLLTVRNLTETQFDQLLRQVDNEIKFIEY